MKSDAPLKLVRDPIRKKEIEDKIDILFRVDNFYFYKAIDAEENEENTSEAVE